jgi:raffinose/stachyose/melibiose transport system permease protein
MMRKKKLPVLKYFLLILVACVQIYPFIWMLFFSLKDNNQIFSMNVMGLPNPVQWSNYTAAVHNGHILQFFFNSTVVTFFAMALTLLLSLMLAYAISRMRWKFGRPLLILFLLGIMIPAQAIVLPVFLMITRLNLYNTRVSLILVYTVITMPVSIYILSAYMRNLPQELEESAALDGADIYRIFFRIIVPIVKPAVITVLILNFISMWNELLLSYILISKTNLLTLTVGLLTMQAKYNTEWGPIGAALVISSFPTVLIYLFLNKYIQESFIMGSVKG